MMTMTWRVVGTVLVITETVDTPSDAEWNAFIRDTIQYRRQVDEMRVLIHRWRWAKRGAAQPHQRRHWRKAIPIGRCI
jgi:hypothetical protein